MSFTRPVRVRIAPSPTGDPHVGTAYVALFNYVFAKQSGGSFILRIEDTDQSRAKSSSEENIITSLRWLGLNWDEGPDCGGAKGPYRQSERKDIYQDYANRLISSGHAYRCFCNAERLTALRETQRAQKQNPGYDRHCLSLSPSEIENNLKDGVPFVVRLKIPEGTTIVNDLLRGPIEIDNRQTDDQILLKSDGYPTYHLANVVDDYLMEVSHVIRAEEWISSTPKHVLLYKAFGWEEPVWVHLPLLRNTDKSKISKRKNPVSLTYYKQAGYVPEALLNFLALMGWNPGGNVEIFSIEEMLANFKLDQINLGDPVFDLVKLGWMNQQYIQKMPVEKFVQTMREEYFHPNYLEQVYPLVRERLEKFEDLFERHSFFFCGPLNYDGVSIVPNGQDKTSVRKVFKELVERLDDVYDWQVQTLEDVINHFREQVGLKPKDFFMPLRLITTGRKDSPPLMETLAVLGRERVRFRIRNALETVLKP